MTSRFHIAADHPAMRQLDLFLAYRRASGKKEATLNGYRRVCARFVAEAPGLPIEPRDWTSDHVVLWLALRRRDGRGRNGGPLDDNTIAYDQRQLYVWLGWLYERDVMPRDPRRGLPVTRTTQKIHRAMAENDVRRMVVCALDRSRGRGTWALTDRPSRLRDAAIVRCLWSTGVRVKELAAMEVADFREESNGKTKVGLLAVRSPKAHEERELPLDAAAYAALLEYLNSERGWEPGPLFRLQRSGIIGMIKKLALLAGVEASPHDFRYGFARRCLDAGMAPVEVQQLLGHATIAMTMRYAQGAAHVSAIRSFREKVG